MHSKSIGAKLKKISVQKKLTITGKLIAKALAEDMPKGDITTMACIDEHLTGRAKLVAKSELVVCGFDVFRAVFRQIEKKCVVTAVINEGSVAKPGETIATITGRLRTILTGERVALNFMQRLSGIATMSRKFVQAVEGSGIKILDTRKTTPLLRDLEKYAVRVGGAENHRRDLSEMILIKENHIKAAGSITKAVKLCRRRKFVEVEVENIKEVEEAIEAGANRILLDNMTPVMVTKCVELIDGRAQSEASGNMTLKKIVKYKKSGVDYISVGGLTHSPESADLSPLVE